MAAETLMEFDAVLRSGYKHARSPAGLNRLVTAGVPTLWAAPATVLRLSEPGSRGETIPVRVALLAALRRV